MFFYNHFFILLSCQKINSYTTGFLIRKKLHRNSLIDRYLKFAANSKWERGLGIHLVILRISLRPAGINIEQFLSAALQIQNLIAPQKPELPAHLKTAGIR